MATSNPYIGRREGVGIGIEQTPGTSVAPQVSLRWLDQDLQNKIEVIENESAMGVVEKINDSEIVAKWAEGTIGGKVTEIGVGFLLLGAYGTVSTGAAVGGYYPHTFSVNQSSIPKTLTFSLIRPLASQRFAYGVVDTFELTAENGGWVEVSCAVKARVGASASDTLAFVTEKEFTSKHISIKTASSVAGLGAASNIKALSLKLSLERPSEPFNALGTDDTPEFDRGVWEAKGEFVVRYTDTQIEDDFLTNTIKALQISIVNGSTSLVFTGGRVRFRELEKSTDKDSITTQTVSFYCELDASTGKTIEPVLTNQRATYVYA